MLDKEIFAQGMALIYSTWNRLKEPDESIIDLWYGILNSIPDGLFIEACKAIAIRTGYPPQNIPSEIIEQARMLSGQLDHASAYSIIENMFQEFMFPGLESSGWTIIQEKLKKQDLEWLIPMAGKYGKEMLNTTNPTALRAQFREQYNQLIRTDKVMQLTTKSPKQIESK